MAGLRSVENAWAQAAELYRQSLALENDAEARTGLAVASLYANRNDDALAAIDQVLASDPKNAAALHLKGKILAARQDYRGAAEALAHSLDLKRDVNAQFELGVAFLNLKEKQKAAAIFQNMLDEYGDRAIWHVIFGGAYRDTKNLDDAVREFKRAIALDPKSPHVHFFLGLTYLEQNYWGSNPQTIAEYDEEVRQFPDDFFGNYGLGGLEAQTGQLAESNRHLLIAAKAQPDNPDPWLYLGLNAFKENDFSKAKPYLLKAAQLTGDQQERNNFQIRRAYIALGRILVTEGKKEEAEPYLEKAKALGAKSMELSSQVITSAMTESGMGSAPGVIPTVAPPRPAPKSADSPPVDPTASPDASSLAETRLTPAQLKEVRAREKELRTILSTSFNDWATAEARQKDYAQALTHFHEAEKWDDSTPGLMRNTGLAALKLGDNHEAARALRIASEKDPQDQLSHAMLGMALFSTHEFSDAAKAFNGIGNAVYRDPRMAYAWAFSLVRSNDPQKAVEVLNKLAAAELPPDMLVGVGDLYSQTGDYEDALRAFRKALAQDALTPRAHYYAGVALIRLDRPNDAIPEFEAELKNLPDDPDVQYHLAYVLLQTSRKEEAVAMLQKLTAAHPEHAQAQYQLGKVLLDDGENQPAIEHLEAAARLDPNEDYIHYQLQSAYRKAGRTAEADNELKVYRDIKERRREAGNPQPKP